jgi:hypothetical protein
MQKTILVIIMGYLCLHQGLMAILAFGKWWSLSNPSYLTVASNSLVTSVVLLVAAEMIAKQR